MRTSYLTYLEFERTPGHCFMFSLYSEKVAVNKKDISKVMGINQM
jgi:hypothetical protein